MPLIGGAADMGELYPQVSRFTKTPTKQSQTDDVILSIRATLGRPIFSDGIYCLGRGVVAFRSSIVTKEFLRYFFIDQENYLYQNATGTTFAQVDSKTLKSMPFPLPPFHEQRRIVRRVESLFSKLDEAKEKAQAVVDSFETRKAAILHKAFTAALPNRECALLSQFTPPSCNGLMICWCRRWHCSIFMLFWRLTERALWARMVKRITVFLMWDFCVRLRGSPSIVRQILKNCVR